MPRTPMPGSGQVELKPKLRDHLCSIDGRNSFAKNDRILRDMRRVHGSGRRLHVAELLDDGFPEVRDAGSIQFVGLENRVHTKGVRKKPIECLPIAGIVAGESAPVLVAQNPAVIEIQMLW